MASIIGIVKQFINKRTDGKSIDEILIGSDATTQNQSIAKMIESIDTQTGVQAIKDYIKTEILDKKTLIGSTACVKALVPQNYLNYQSCGNFTPSYSGTFFVCADISNTHSTNNYSYYIRVNSTETAILVPASSRFFCYIPVNCSKGSTYDISSKRGSNAGYHNAESIYIGASIEIDSAGT